MTKNILVLANKYTTIINFRLELIEALVNEGYNVYVSLPYHERVKEIEAIGANIIQTDFNKESINPVSDLSLMVKYISLIKKLKADLVLTFTIKPNIYGGMASMLCGVPYVANITGLGKALENGGIIQKIATILYKISFYKISAVFFQNTQNMEFFKTKKIALGKHVLIPGSGVNLKKFSQMVYPGKDVIEFAFISRIMKEKGIEFYINLAIEIKKLYPNTKFHVCGFGTEFYEEWMQQAHEDGIIEYHGLLNDVRTILKDVHCIIHPTFYPEGMSNVLLESAASARPIISTDRAGCREAIDDGVNGYIVKEKNYDDLQEKVIRFIELPYEEKKTMGLNGRKKVEKEFDRNIIVNKYLEMAKKLI